MSPRQVLRALVLVGLILPVNAWAWESGDLRLRGKLQTRFMTEEKDEGGWTSGFSIEHARFDGRWMPNDWSRLVLEIECAEPFSPGDQTFAGAALKDAYARFEPFKWLKIQAGQFKKPFSRLRLTSPWELLIPERGLLDRRAISQTLHGGFGGRDLGVMAFGRLKKLLGLRYYLGAFTGPGTLDGADEHHQDFVARLTLEPFAGLEVGLNASHKLYTHKLGYPPTDRLRPNGRYTATLFGADAALSLAGFRLEVEGAIGDSVDAGPGHKLWGAHGIASYAIALADDLTLIPALMVEAFDPDDQVTGGRGLRLAGSLNLDLGKTVRVAVFAEGTQGELRWADLSSNQLLTAQRETRIGAQLNVSF